MIAATNGARGTTAQERGARVDQEPLAEGLTPYEHPEAHVAAIRQRGLRGDRLPEELDVQQNHDAVLTVTRRAAHGTTIVNLAFDNRSVGIRLLPWHDREPNPIAAIGAGEFFNIRRVDGRTVRTRVEFGFNPRNADFG